jgi:hypothetical protein
MNVSGDRAGRGGVCGGGQKPTKIDTRIMFIFYKSSKKLSRGFSYPSPPFLTSYAYLSPPVELILPWFAGASEYLLNYMTIFYVLEY